MGTHKLPLIASLAVIFLLLLLLNKYHHYHYVTRTIIAISTAFAKPHTVALPTLAGPMILNDSNLKIETVFKGLDAPTSMAFVGPNDI